MTAAQEASDDTPELFVSVWAAIELVESASRCDNAELARDALDRVVAATAVARTDWASGVAARSRALLSEGKAADGLYREAIERLGRTRLRPELARAHLLYGEWLRRGESSCRRTRPAPHGPRAVHRDRHGGLRPAPGASCWRPARRCARGQ